MNLTLTKFDNVKPTNLGKPLFGKDGAFALVLQGFIQAVLEAEMKAHMDPKQHIDGNKRNGKAQKK